MNLPFVSVIIPCRNEEKYIGKCLESIIQQDFPKENLEVLATDGDSEDKTREIVKEFSIKYPFIKLLENPKKFTPFGLNIGVKAATGEIIIRMDAHAGYGKDYISKCVKYLEESGADNVGGTMRTLPAKDTKEARAIALVLSDPAGAASRFRLGSEKVEQVDTVFGGCFKREVFSPPPDGVGLFNEKLLRGQDLEFNKRLKKAGGKIVLVPNIVAIYHPQATLRGFFKHNFSDGFWITYPLKFGIRYFSLRHLIPLILVGGLLTGLLIEKGIFILLSTFYLLGVGLVSFKIAFKEGLKYFPALAAAIFCRHIGYGLGSVWGLIRAVF